MDQPDTRLSVLLADDHLLVAEALAAVLATEYDLVGIVADGQTLIHSAAELQPDVIVSDIGMPGLNGIEALPRLKAVAPRSRVVMLTMHRTPAYVQQALSAGASAYVLKHAASTELLDAVRAAGRGETWTSPEVAQMNGSEDAAPEAGKPLSARQQQILRLLVDGLSAKEIAAELNISPRTVEFHKYAMMEALEISSTAALIRYALKSGLADL